MSTPSPQTCVLIDASNPAYLVFVFDPVIVPLTVERCAWSTFSDELERRLAALTGADAERCNALAHALRTTLAANPGVPVGVTWDGGFAITFQDYRAAERRLAAQRSAPR